MTRIRILLFGMPRMLRDLIGGIVEPQPDMEIVGDVESEDEVLAALDRSRAEFLIAGLDGAELPRVCNRVLFHRPEVTVFGLSPEGRQGFLYELRPHAIPVGEVSPGLLLEVIRQARPGDERRERPMTN